MKGMIRQCLLPFCDTQRGQTWEFCSTSPSELVITKQIYIPGKYRIFKIFPQKNRGLKGLVAGLVPHALSETLLLTELVQKEIHHVGKPDQELLL